MSICGYLDSCSDRLLMLTLSVVVSCGLSVTFNVNSVASA